jgi:Zn-dependent peptidase ImmA (M78 family)
MGYDRGDYRDKWRLESRAAAVRAQVGLNQLSVLDPDLLVDHLGAAVFHLRDLVEDKIALRRSRRIGFDGAASTHPETGRPLIILNCGKPQRRRTATLMEELAHLLLGHRPCRIAPDPRLGIIRRSFNQEQEHEAYDFGAALLLPKERIQQDVKERQILTSEIADAHRCSEQLVAFRIRRMRLWKRYSGYASAAS